MSQIISIKVVPNAKVSKVKAEKDYLKIYVKAPAENGEANSAVLEVLASHFKLNKSEIELVKGEKSREKWIRIK